MVKQYKLAPSEVWKMDFVEVNYIIDSQQNNIDISFMLNHERIQNGANPKWLQKV